MSAPTFCTKPGETGRWDNQCARCGSSVHFVECEHCGGDGFGGHDCGEDCCVCAEPEENVPCDWCCGTGGGYECLSSQKYCESHPIPSRETVKRGAVEWFQVELPKEDFKG